MDKYTLALENFKNYLTFDDGELRLYAKDNPKGFLKNLDLPVCLDEIQKVPALLETIKMHIDINRVNGNFLLTGSSNNLNFLDKSLEFRPDPPEFELLDNLLLVDITSTINF